MNLVKIDGYVEGDIIPLKEAKVGMMVNLIVASDGGVWASGGLPLRYLVVEEYDGVGLVVQYSPYKRPPATSTGRANTEDFSHVQVISYEPDLS